MMSEDEKYWDPTEEQIKAVAAEVSEATGTLGNIPGESNRVRR